MGMKKVLPSLILAVIFIGIPGLARGVGADADADGLRDVDEAIYKTNPAIPDTDGDGFSDGEEVFNSFDPNVHTFERDDRIAKKIVVTIKTQTLQYSHGPYEIGSFKISSGVKKTPTPKGTYSILEKRPVNLYKGKGYYYPNTKWNLKFLPGTQGNYYIHGAYWHNNFGKPMSHGCVNASYKNMEPLYNWADVGTPVIIQ
jgi:lipoprotein-anchoring transpeptidase ErfK/SrfK